MKNTIYLFCLSFFILFGCCDDDSGHVICDEGFEEVDGKCICPEDMFPAYGFCNQLEEREWYGITDGCLCVDTIFFKIVEDFGNEVRVHTSPGGPLEPGEPGWLVGASFLMDYIALPDGDSLGAQGLPYGPILCNQDNFGAAEFYEVLSGKIAPDGNSITMKIEFRNFQTPTIIVDSCLVTFRR